MSENVVETPKSMVTIHKGFKFRLAPNKQQAKNLARDGGAARFMCNAMTAYNVKIQQNREEYIAEREAEGVSRKDANKELKVLAKENPKYKTMSAMAYDTQIMTPEINRHREAAKAIENGADPAEVWGEEGTPWLHNINRRVLVSGLRDSGAAMENFFGSITGERAGKRMGKPKFKSREANNDSFTVPAMGSTMGGYGELYLNTEPMYRLIQDKVMERERINKVPNPRTRGQIKPRILDYTHVRLAHLGVFKVHGNTREMMNEIRNGGVLKSFTVSQGSSKYWYVSFLVEMQKSVAEPTKRQLRNGSVGVDYGVKVLAALSDQDAPNKIHESSEISFVDENTPLVVNPRWKQKDAKRITKLQQELQQKKKGSNNRRRARQKLGVALHKQSLHRKSYTDQLSKFLVTNYSLIGIEDLNVSGMTASAAGTIENPGKNVAQKSGLNREVLDVAPATFRRQLEYKAPWHGAVIQPIDRFFPSSQLCSNCGKRPGKDLTLSDRTYKCEHCGTSIDRDFNASKNIQKEAERLHREGQ